MKGSLVFEEGYSRPDWGLIGEVIRKIVSPGGPCGSLDGSCYPVGATRVGRIWAKSIAPSAAAEFILLSSLEPKAAGELLMFAERMLDQIQSLLQDAAWKTGLGKHVIFLFAEDDDYYQYVSYFYRDGVHPTSGGCLIQRDFVHIAMPYLNGRNVRRTLAHELMHNCVVHLQLPLWLNEGLAVVFDRSLAQSRQPVLSQRVERSPPGLLEPGEISSSSGQGFPLASRQIPTNSVTAWQKSLSISCLASPSTLENSSAARTGVTPGKRLPWMFWASTSAR